MSAKGEFGVQSSEFGVQKVSILRVLAAMALATFVLAGTGEPVVAEVSEAQVMEVAEELACLCGSCPNRPLHECRCGYAGQQRDRIARELAAGKSKEQVLAGFVGEFGEKIYVTPPKEGFNLMAWIMPFLGIVLGGVAVRAVLKGWKREDKTPTRDPSRSLTEEERAKLDAELNRE